MGMVVRTNTMALNAYRQLGMNNSAVAKSLEKLSSGFRINRAGDDAAGLAISEKMKAQITGLETASANAQDGISLIQTAEGNLNEVHDMLNRMVELASKSANGTYTSQERKALQDEVDSLLSEIDRISQSANFNGTKLLNGTMGLNNDALTIGASTGHVAAGTKTGDAIVDANGTKLVAVEDSHVSAGKDEVKPALSIDLANYEYTVEEKGANAKDEDVTFTLKIDGKAIEKIDKGAGKGGAVVTDAFKFESIADTNGLVTKGTDIVAKLAANDLVKIGGDVYEVKTAADDTLTLEWKGVYKAVDGGLDDTKTSFADSANDGWTPVGKVTIDATPKTGTTGSVTDDRINCSVYSIKDGVVGGAKVRAGASLTLTADMIKAGNTLKIGETTFTFAEGKAPTSITANATGADQTIKVDSSLSEAEQLKMVTEQLSYYSAKIIKDPTDTTDTGTVFKIGRFNGTNKIEIEEEVAAGADPKGFTKDQMKNAFGVTTQETMANTKITLRDNDALANKEKILIDGNEVEFTKGADTAATLTNIQAALGNDYTATINGSELTIAAKVSTAGAPKIAGAGLTLQIGDTADSYNKMNVKVADMSTTGLGINGLSIMNEGAASDAIDTIKAAINTVSNTRAGMGALQNRLEHTINNLDVAVENLSAANSRIRDTDMAKEMMNYTKMNVLVQSAQAMLAQANQQPQSVLQLLQ